MEPPDNADRMLSAVSLPAMLGLPDEVLAIVFGFYNAWARMMAIPAVSRLAHDQPAPHGERRPGVGGAHHRPQYPWQIILSI